MIGVKQDDGNFLFKHLCGLLKFSIVDIPDDAKQVIITAKGENAPNISGTCIVEDVIEDGVVLSIPEGSSQVTIKIEWRGRNTNILCPCACGCLFGIASPIGKRRRYIFLFRETIQCYHSASYHFPCYKRFGRGR